MFISVMQELFNKKLSRLAFMESELYMKSLY